MAITGLGNSMIQGSLPHALSHYSSILQAALMGEEQYDSLIFVHEGKKQTFKEWMDQGSAQDRILCVSRAELQSREELDQRILHAFQGGHQLMLLLDKGAEQSLFRAREILPRPLLMKAQDIIAFAEKSPHAEEIQRDLLWQNEHNLQFSPENRWASFKAHFKDDQVDELLMLWSLCFAGENSMAIYQEWDRYTREYSNPDKRSRYEFELVDKLQADKTDWMNQDHGFPQALEAIRDYAARMDPHGWAKHFNALLEMLKSGKAEMDGYLEIFQDCGASEKQLCLIGTALRSDVFGGMGSWNDVPFMQDPEYGKVSESLFKALYQNISFAVSIIGHETI